MNRKQKVPTMHGLYDTWKRQDDEQKEQERLHEKHQVADTKVLIVEKNNILKYIVRFGKLLGSILIYVLASIGLTCLVYPDTRQGLFAILENIGQQLRTFM